MSYQLTHDINKSALDKPCSVSIQCSLNSRPALAMNDSEGAEVSPKRASKSSRVCNFLPSIRPSYLSLILIFVCGFLWLKYEDANDRLLELDNQLMAFRMELKDARKSVREEQGTTSPSGRKL